MSEKTQLKAANPPWTSRSLRLGLVQFSMTEDMDENLNRALSLSRKAAADGAQFVCLPELFRSPYFCKEPSCSADYTEHELSVLTDTLSSCAKELGVVLIAGSIYEETAEGELYNTALVFDADGKQLGSYRKMHIPHDPSFYELCYFKPGESGFRVFETKFARISVLICYDQWFPEAARSAALMGAEIIFYPTAIGTVEHLSEDEGSWQSYWERVQQGHAGANNVVVAAVNRVGREGSSRFWGGSFAANAVGEIIKKAGNETEVLLVDIDLGHSDYVRKSWRFLESRRPEHYIRITES